MFTINLPMESQSNWFVKRQVLRDLSECLQVKEEEALYNKRNPLTIQVDGAPTQVYIAVSYIFQPEKNKDSFVHYNYQVRFTYFIEL